MKKLIFQLGVFTMALTSFVACTDEDDNTTAPQNQNFVNTQIQGDDAPSIFFKSVNSNSTLTNDPCGINISYPVDYGYYDISAATFDSSTQSYTGASLVLQGTVNNEAEIIAAWSNMTSATGLAGEDAWFDFIYPLALIDNAGTSFNVADQAELTTTFDSYSVNCMNMQIPNIIVSGANWTGDGRLLVDSTVSNTLLAVNVSLPYELYTSEADALAETNALAPADMISFSGAANASGVVSTTYYRVNDPATGFYYVRTMEVTE